MKHNFKIGDNIIAAEKQYVNGKLRVVKSHSVKRNCTLKAHGTIYKLYKTSRKGSRSFEYGGGAGRHLTPNRIYKVESILPNGGIMLEGFTIPVSHKDIKHEKDQK